MSANHPWFYRSDQLDLTSACSPCLTDHVMAKLVSLNVKGLNSNVKRRLLLTELKSSKADIAFVQETHFNRTANFAFARGLYPTVYMSLWDRKKAGVAILISRSCPLQVLESVSDPGSRYIILSALYRDVPLLLCNVYTPNGSQILLTKLSRFPPSVLIIRGDFNVAFSERVYKLRLQGMNLNPSLANISRSFRRCIPKFLLFDL